ncbi:MAG: hypothetical protein HQK89_08125 [Nitrospirae bacterium]|nr:hypothetical protein [Nitrospirota bacterium]
MRVLCVTTALVLLVFAAPMQSFASGAPGEQERAAVKGLGSLLQGSSFHKKIGISSEKSSLESTIGAGFQIYTITPRQLGVL